MINAVTPSEMQELENALFDSGTDPAWLMDQAGRGLFDSVADFFPNEMLSPGTAVLFAGKGHNAGDGYHLLRHLHEAGWEIYERTIADPSESKKNTSAARNLAKPEPWHNCGVTVSVTRPLLVIDGLLGIGASGPPRENILTAIREINELRENHKAQVIAIDTPTGLDSETGKVATEAVRAHLTVTFGRAKTGLLPEHAAPWVGRLTRVTLPGIEPDTQLICAENVAQFLPKRDPSWHKGTAGRVSIIAGSKGYYGAAQLSAEAALHAGAGLVTLWADKKSADILATRVAPEIMVQTLENPDDLFDFQADAFVIGPGLGERAADLFPWYQKEKRPVVVDADFLTFLAKQDPKNWPAPGTRVWTPHPGEVARFFPHEKPVTPETHLQKLAALAQSTILWKGARTQVFDPETGDQFYNSTGHPGMASAGMGDTLAGVIVALLGQKVEPAKAAISGAWLCGRAAELACALGHESWESTRATSVINFLGPAFEQARSHAY